MIRIFSKYVDSTSLSCQELLKSPKALKIKIVQIWYKNHVSVKTTHRLYIFNSDILAFLSISIFLDFKISADITQNKYNIEKGQNDHIK